MTQGREYAEFIWPIDVMVMTGLLMAGYNIYGRYFPVRRRNSMSPYGT